VSQRTKLAATGLLVLGLGPSLAGQEPALPALTQERVRLALQSQPSMIVIVPPGPEGKLGMLTLVPPEGTGEMIRVRVPIGDLASRAAHAIARARRNRAEKAARDEVARSLAEFLAKQPR
jgi:hypothetical protein